MKYVLIGLLTGASMETIMDIYPRHKVLVDELPMEQYAIVSTREGGGVIPSTWNGR
jgi:hypothetical protein